MIWIAVTADEFELPIAHASTGAELARIMGVSKSSISGMECRYRNGITHSGKKRKGRITRFGQPYRVVKVKE